MVTSKKVACLYAVYLKTLPEYMAFFLGVQLGPLGISATNRPIVPDPGDYDDGKIGGMIGRGNRSTRRKPVPVPLWLRHGPIYDLQHEIITWKGCAKKRSLPKLRYYPEIRQEVLTKTTKKETHSSCPGRDSNRPPLE
jgi:hypothetical protein